MTNDALSLRGSYADAIDRVVEPTFSIDDIDSLADDVLTQGRQAICVTDAELDLPGPRIQFVNAAYLDLFACEERDVIGVSPRFAQGPLTDRLVLDRIRANLEAGRSMRAQAINYRVDRTPFRLRWSVDPIRRGGRIVRFVAFMNDVTIEDRMRRRLSALDTLLLSARSVAAGRPVALRSAESLAAALVPILAEVSRATVTIGTKTVRVGGLDGALTAASTVPVGDLGSIRLEAHPDADRLLDQTGIEELAHHAGWLFEPGR